MALTPLAHYLANFFTTPNELPYVTSAKEWERLSSEEFWIHALLSESCRFDRELAKAADTKDDTKYQSIEESSTCRQSQMSTILPSPHSPYSKYISTFLSAFLMSFPQTHFAALHDEHARATRRLTHDWLGRVVTAGPPNWLG